MNKQKREDSWTFSLLQKKGKTQQWKKFPSDNVLRKQLLVVIKEYDEMVAEITKPNSDRNNEHNRVFERNVLIDHIEMIVEQYFTAHSK